VSFKLNTFTLLKLAFWLTLFMLQHSNYHYLCTFRWNIFSSISSSQIALAKEITTKRCSSNQFTKWSHSDTPRSESFTTVCCLLP